MTFLDRLPLKWKLLIMLLIPILGLTWFGIDNLRTTNVLLDETDKVRQLTELSVKTSALVHELQKERGLSAGYLGSGGKKFIDDLPVQRKLTDTRAAELTAYLDKLELNFGADFKSAMDSALNDLAMTGNIRRKITQQNIPLKNAIGFYTRMNSGFIELIAVLPKLSSLGEINNAATAYVNFVLSKERAGIERAVLAATFSANQFAPDMYNRFQSLVTEQATYFDVFKSLATAQQNKDFNSLFQDEAFNEAARMRSIAIEKSLTGGFDIDSKYWFKMQTAKINLLKEFEDGLSRDLVDLADSTHQAAMNSLYLSMASAFISIFLGILVSWVFSRIILGQLGEDPEKLLHITEEIAKGNLNVKLNREGKKSVGVFASMQTMRDNLRQRIEADHQAAAENNRIKQALDNVKANVMIADREHKIIYINPSLMHFLKQSETNIRQSMNGFNSDELVGSNVSHFYEAKENFLNNLSDTHQTELQMGNSHFRLFSSPVIDENDERHGTVIEWVDRYQEAVVQDEMQSIIQSALAGELSMRINLDDKSGFIRRLGEGINQLINVCDQVINDTVQALSAISKGDLTQGINNEYEGAFAKLKDDVNATITRLTEVTDEIRTSSHMVLTGSQEIAEGNTNLSHRTEQQAANLEETASSMEEMTATVKQNADNARRANQLASETRKQAEDGGNVVTQAVSAMNEITDSSNKIAAIISVIDEIAFQTNLLALNAAVEAARAGEQGRGFAVVASEVRNLAGRSASAAKEIKDLIEDSVKKVGEGSKLVDASGQTLDTIMSSVKIVSGIIAEIAAASQEQSEGIELVNNAIAQMDDVTQQNAALVEEAAAASETMGDQARNLNELIGFFRTSNEVSAYSMVERRKTTRPWHEESNRKPEIECVHRPSKTVKAVVNTTDIDEWEEF